MYFHDLELQTNDTINRNQTPFTGQRKTITSSNYNVVKKNQ